VTSAHCCRRVARTLFAAEPKGSPTEQLKRPRARRYLEKLMKFINRNAYIIVAVKGYSYCGAALRAAKLIVNNIARLAAVNIIGDALIFLGKLTVVLACGCIAFALSGVGVWGDPESDKYLASPLVPVALACLSGYVVASIFFSVRCPLRVRRPPARSCRSRSRASRRASTRRSSSFGVLPPLLFAACWTLVPACAYHGLAHGGAPLLLHHALCGALAAPLPSRRAVAGLS
jgi:Plasma-membrane choline transporter